MVEISYSLVLYGKKWPQTHGILQKIGFVKKKTVGWPDGLLNSKSKRGLYPKPKSRSYNGHFGMLQIYGGYVVLKK